MLVEKASTPFHCDDCGATPAVAHIKVSDIGLLLCATCLVKLSVDTEELCHEVLPAEPAGGG